MVHVRYVRYVRHERPDVQPTGTPPATLLPAGVLDALVAGVVEQRRCTPTGCEPFSSSGHDSPGHGRRDHPHQLLTDDGVRHFVVEQLPSLLEPEVLEDEPDAEK